MRLFLSTTVVALVVCGLPAMAASELVQDCLHKRGSEAVNACTRAIAKNPRWVEYFNRGLAYKRMGDNEHAITDYDRALAMNPKYSDGFVNRALLFGAKGDTDRALADFAQAIALNPSSTLAYRNRASLLHELGRLDEALSDVSRAISLSPGFAGSYNDRGNIYREREDFTHALADYTQAILLDGQSYMAYNGRGLTRTALGDREAGLRDLEQAIALNPQFAPAFVNRGQLAQAAGDLPRAIADYSHALSLDPKRVEAWNNRGLAYAAQNDFAHAMVDLNEALKLPDRDAMIVYVNRGLVRFYSSDVDEALADFERAAEASPESASAALWLELAGRRRGLQSRLAQSLDKLNMTKWPAPVVRLYLGQLTPEAVIAAAGADPHKLCDANFFAGELAIAKGAHDEAARLLHAASQRCEKSQRNAVAVDLELKALESAAK